ncbi:hypothetical protein [uncultured Sphingomonas sp.]
MLPLAIRVTLVVHDFRSGIAGPVTILFLLLARPGFRRLALKASSAVRLD